MPDTSTGSAPDPASVILHTDQQVLLYKRDDHPTLFPLFPCRWEIFGGGIEAEESPEETVCRELRVELGYSLIPSDLELLGRSRVIEPPTTTWSAIPDQS